MERIFNGALSLIGILMALFIYIFMQYVNPDNQGIYKVPYKLLSIIIGGLIVGSGGLALSTHFLLPRECNRFVNWLLVILLVALSLLPIIIWIRFYGLASE